MVEALGHLLLSSAILMLFSVPTDSAAAKSNQTKDQILFDKTVETLKKTLHFFNREYRNVNLDAIIGTRIVEGQLTVLLQRITKNPHHWPVDDYLLRDLSGLRDLAKDISDKAISFVEASDIAYYKKIGALLAPGFWELDYPSRDFTGIETYWPYQPGETLREEDSDNCLAEFFGTG
ncbi:hypothetical protein CHS0354_005956 [Potamilus streckersoni]|uniref:Uncharacterized protein n=1 Tax=Potamilus streckersoni TaxID=2493646 RepID=A0AAE0SMY4_9BIVA|nr:hypothetical protein CHS0354_005956 [Potamilus streckersoni]